MRAIKVHPGEFYVTSQHIALVTILGSCVSACIRDPVAGIGGMNHFMLPETGSIGPNGGSARYGSYAMELLVNELLKEGATRSRLEAKVFGGGNVLKSFSTNPIGTSNARFVREYLATEGIPIVAEDLLGDYARKLYFFPATGRVLVCKLGIGVAAPDLDSERAYGQRLKVEPVQGDVELFD
jgi:chemotaxis protein CheD